MILQSMKIFVRVMLCTSVRLDKKNSIESRVKKPRGKPKNGERRETLATMKMMKSWREGDRIKEGR